MNGCVRVLVLLACIAVSTADFVSSDNFAEMKYGDKVVRNNLWGQNTGAQTITAVNGSHFCVACSHESKGGIKSYPHSGYMINKKVSDVHTLKSTYKATVENANKLAYSFTYDIWLQNHKYEIMIWLSQAGEVGPIGTSCATNVNVGGHNWKQVYKGSNGQNQVFSFINQKPELSGSIDLKAIIDYCQTQKWFAEGPNTMLQEVQLGFEITNTPPNTKLCLTGYTVSCT